MTTNARTDREALDGAEDGARFELARACRALAVAGVLGGVLGHISVRRGSGSLLIRCRGSEERGLRFTDMGDIQRVDVDGAPPEDPSFSAPRELPIHTAVLKARPEVEAVVHAHPPYSLLAGRADLELLPMFGAYNISAMRLSVHGIGVYPRSVLLDDDVLAAEMVEAMGDSSVCLLRGHGVVTTGLNLEAAVVAAVNLETLARVAVELHRMGVSPRSIPAADMEHLPDLGAAFNDGLSYRHLLAELDAAEQGMVGRDQPPRTA